MSVREEFEKWVTRSAGRGKMADPVYIVERHILELQEDNKRLRAEVANLKNAAHIGGSNASYLYLRARKAEAERDRLRELLLALRRNPHIEEILRWDANLAYLERIDAALDVAGSVNWSNASNRYVQKVQGREGKDDSA